MIYGLYGKNLSHSLSKEIHQMFGNEDYQLCNVKNVESIFTDKEVKGFNITIPYKTAIIPYLHKLDDVAKATNSVNTVIRKEDGFYGYNTDYYGFVQTLKYNKVSVKEKDILIIGNGSVSLTIQKALLDLGAKSVKRLCRQIKDENDILFNKFKDYQSFEIIVNTTPVGMYPHNDDDLLVDLNKFNNLKVVIDLIYNPIRTKLLLSAEDLGIKAINGLYMLVLQAKKAHELFFNKIIPLNKANRVFMKLQKNIYNLVFIGLPLSGKSKYAKLTSKKLFKTCVDIDNEIEKKANTKIANIFTDFGETYFRNLESEVVSDVYKTYNQCISTGGGLIKNKENMLKLRQNGIIIFLDKDPNKIAAKTIYGRPLIKSGQDLLDLAKERLPIYREFADITIVIDKDTDTHLNEIKEKYYEYINR